jgi:release factor glutamine methyltransferase
MVVANLPYVRDCEFRDLSPEIREHEPTIALAGGRDGLDKIREMLEQMRGKGGTHCGGPVCLLLEIGQGQASIELISDLGGIERVVKVGLSSGGSGLK